MTKRVLIPLPSSGFEPTECSVPWEILTDAGVEVTIATPDGRPGEVDDRMLTGRGFGPWAPFMAAGRHARSAFAALSASPAFHQPLRWADVDFDAYDGLLLPGGHAPGMKEYLEADLLQRAVVRFFELDRPVGAICHGVVLMARSRRPDGASVLHGRQTTCLLARQELLAWGLTCAWLGSYYRTYPQTVEAEVKAALASPADFQRGPLPLLRDDPDHLARGFVVEDGNYLSARWPGDAHAFGVRFLDRLVAAQADPKPSAREG